MCRKASVALFILILGPIFIPFACAQYDPDSLFQFSKEWQRPVNETNLDFNFDPGPLIDERDLLRLIEEWKDQAPTETPTSNTPTATPTPTNSPSITTTPTATWTPATGDLVIDLTGGIQVAFMLIPAGSFDMGAEYDPIWSGSNERPVHSVTIGYDFYVGKTEITQAQWLAVMQRWPYDKYNPNTYSKYGLGDNYPAYFITWNDCHNFITALNQLGQGTFRLPSEAEWEYACRAGTTTRFYFGDSDGCWTECDDCAAGVLPGNRTDYMWYCGNNTDLLFGTKPVGQLIPNDFGLCDMHGDVYEWCEDDWHNSYTSAPEDGSPWVESPRAYYRVARGGSWGYDAKYCRSASRTGPSADRRSSSIGFRIVREVE